MSDTTTTPHTCHTDTGATPGQATDRCPRCLELTGLSPRTDEGHTTTAAAILAACVLALMCAIGAAWPAHGATVPASSSHTTGRGTGYASSPVVGPARMLAMVTPCALEDSTGCYWNASTMGNGRGHGFYAVATAPGVVCVDMWGTTAGDYCDTDTYAPAGVPVWRQVSGPAARELARTRGRTVDVWARCAASSRGVVCPDGYRSGRVH